jgi:Xaa-Pro aminopeptidase
MLRDDERVFLNNYHKKVYDILSPHLSDGECEFLSNYTKEI